MNRKVSILILSVWLLTLMSCSYRDVFNGDRAYAWVTRQCDLGYRISGSPAHQKAGDMIVKELRRLGWEVHEQTFTYKGVTARNIVGNRGSGPAILIGAHYDTRRAADQEDPTVPVLGANDGASGVAVLLEMARVLDVSASGRTFYLAFFDAEDNGRLDGWEWIIGSSYMAQHWGEAGEPALSAMILVDMIGDEDQQLYLERNSDEALSREIWAVAAESGYRGRFITEYKYSMLDDHIPFVALGVPSVDIIDFDYPYWHTTQDTADKVSSDSLAAVGRTLETWLEQN